MLNLTKIAKALADENRFEILKLIADRGEISCGELTQKFGLAQPTISYHLKILQDAHLINMRKAKQFAYFSVNFDVIKQFIDLIENAILKKVNLTNS